MKHAPDTIKRLIETFGENIDSYRSGSYNEARVRVEFIDPMFKALGWDVSNEAGYAEAFKDVIHEDAIKVGGATKAPDYCFRIGGTRKFFVEAKKPAVNIRTDPTPAYQLRRYAWSAKLPLSILTDFEEFAVYDCRMRPVQHDKASMGRILYIKYTDYIDRWDEIASVFSKEAILKGSFDKYAESTRRKRGTAEVDASFLAEIESWRDELARNIARRNRDLGVREMNQAVQRTVDRILFLRMCEDRGVEKYGRLQALLNGENVYGLLGELFNQADDKYNSGLFHFKSERGREGCDAWTLELAIDDKVLKGIIKRLYYPECPFEFSVLPADILGHIYEQFLGKVIRLTKGHQAKVEEKPEVRKAGGVYYTPTYIVDYIVENTVGKLCKKSTPKKVAKLRILDPACGSGSFLLGAYQFLLDWHLKWYLDHDPEKHARGKKPAVYQSRGGWTLTTSIRKEILLNNIYGVDIDAQAVEVTKLSLLLKVLEGQTAEGIRQQLALFRERALPDLASNIKCGNSLIGPDFYDGKQTSLFGEDDLYRINAFDWNNEFPEIMERGGFDAVIGNPPYGSSLSAIERDYFRTRFEKTARSSDSYELFLGKAMMLLGSGGRLSMIIPSSWLTGDRFSWSRRTLLTSLDPVAAYALPFDVFKDAYIDTAIVVLARSSGIDTCLLHYFPKKEKLSEIPQGIGVAVPIDNVLRDPTNRLTVLLSIELEPILSKVNTAGTALGQIYRVQRGVQPYSRKKHSERQISERFLHADTKLSDDYLPELQGCELSRYTIAAERCSYIRFCDDIASSRSIAIFSNRRIVLRRLLTRKFRLQASMTAETMITTDNVLNLVPTAPGSSVAFVLGVLNSKLTSWLYVNTSATAQKDDFPQVYISALRHLRIPDSDRAHHDRMVELVERMLELHKRLQVVRTEQDKTLLRRQIAATDGEIDRLVYELYGLTEAEIRIVEGSG
ncbi:N-6 DNA methylase [bacterium]|nr:N-6 DNA methylase [bacterium]